MNIKQAKDYIKDSVLLYLKKDEFGEYRIPVVRQRPIFMLGAPGVGKTAVMEQIAQELGIALVSYSMTHHTRQSALGLPFIAHKEYGGESFDVSEYTMSEIIASVYETMEVSGIREGILFLDEINCVSETLAPSMLQFLQYKVFGRHQVPDGWVIVTAGNPPEYNKSVREFDVVTMDRLKVLEVEADYSVWKEYAKERGIHSAIVSFLETQKDYFYKIETTASGRSYVTARGWEDLSEIILLYEEEGLKVDETLVGQYLRNDRIVREFCAFYDLYNKYKRDYQIDDILSGNIPEYAITRAQNAGFDERLSLLGMMLDRVTTSMQEVVIAGEYLSDVMTGLNAIKARTDLDVVGIANMLGLQAEGRQKKLRSLGVAGALSGEDKKKNQLAIRFLTGLQKEILAGDSTSVTEVFDKIKASFNQEVADMKAKSETTKQNLHYLFEFAAKAYEAGNEMLVMVTELTVHSYSSRFIARFGSDDYVKYNKELMLSERGIDIKNEIEELGI